MLHIGANSKYAGNSLSKKQTWYKKCYVRLGFHEDVMVLKFVDWAFTKKKHSSIIFQRVQSSTKNKLVFLNIVFSFLISIF